METQPKLKWWLEEWKKETLGGALWSGNELVWQMFFSVQEREGIGNNQFKPDVYGTIGAKNRTGKSQKEKLIGNEEKDKLTF